MRLFRIDNLIIEQWLECGPVVDPPETPPPSYRALTKVQPERAGYVKDTLQSQKRSKARV
jgi:hypothetical protein